MISTRSKRARAGIRPVEPEWWMTPDYLEAVYDVELPEGVAVDELGAVEPRLSTRPLRELTPETSHGFHVIEFALRFLGIVLYPWQRALLIRALELNEDGTYRFRRVIVLVGRQNGKTLLLTVLTLWWLFIDSDSFPEHAPARDFLVLGTAQNLDIAEEAWEAAVAYCDPEEGRDGSLVELAVPVLQAAARVPVRKNGQKALRLRSGARYEVRAANRKGGRGKSATRIVMDELREQTTWDAWAAVAKTMQAKFNAQLWGISNAGDAKSVVLAHVRDELVAACAAWDAYVETGLQELEWWSNQHDSRSALFEYSALEDLPVDDVDGILQANPSAGWSPMRLADLLASARSEPEALFRTETLCQWVTARVDPHLDPREWGELADSLSALDWSRPVACAVDVSHDRQWSHIAIAGHREDGLAHVELVASRAGMLWVPGALEWLRDSWGVAAVALQGRGCAAGEFSEGLRALDLEVLEIVGPALGSVAGGIRDRVQAGTLRHRGQEPLRFAVEGGMAKPLGEVLVFDRANSPVDVSPLVAVAEALWALEHLPEVVEVPSPPPAAGLVVVERSSASADVNLAVAAF